MLYDGFLDDGDRNLCEQAITMTRIACRAEFPFSDQCLPELLFRYRARNFLRRSKPRRPSGGALPAAAVRGNIHVGSI